MATVSARRRLVGGCFGNTCELFDFPVYALAAPALALHFFPKTNPTAALLGTFAVYAHLHFSRGRLAES